MSNNIYTTIEKVKSEKLTEIVYNPNNKFCVYWTFYFGERLPKYYIGSSNIEKIKAGYSGSIRSKKYKKIFDIEKKENPELFYTIILETSNDRKEMLNLEHDFQILNNVVKSEKFMNMSFATKNGYFGRNVSGKNNPMFGVKRDEKWKKQHSELMKLVSGDKKTVENRSNAQKIVQNRLEVIEKKRKSQLKYWKENRTEVIHAANWKQIINNAKNNPKLHFKNICFLTKQRLNDYCKDQFSIIRCNAIWNLDKTEWNVSDIELLDEIKKKQFSPRLSIKQMKEILNHLVAVDFIQRIGEPAKHFDSIKSISNKFTDGKNTASIILLLKRFGNSNKLYKKELKSINKLIDRVKETNNKYIESVL